MYQLPRLPYHYSALEPVISHDTMKVHHDGLQKSYVAKLNNALKSASIDVGDDPPPVQDLLLNLENFPVRIRQQIRDFAGGHLNHMLFWSMMTPDPSVIGEELEKAINETFESPANFQELFNSAAIYDLFGSGWIWLVVNQHGELEITVTKEQDNPILFGQIPILGLDMWEHAYFLDHKSKKFEYVQNWWNVVNWDDVSQRYDRAKGK